MPKEHKKRGRREEKKRKREDIAATGSPLKRFKSDGEIAEDQTEENVNFITEGQAGDDFIGFHEKADPLEAVFYGLLDQEEQDYYASANTKLEANDFEDADDRSAFIEAVYRESDGKELKIACSQSCSRYLERLILVSTPDQLKTLFTKFKTHFLHLVQHRFASHCCEALFLESARHMDQTDDSESGSPSFEDLFLETVQELSDNLGYLLTERFASHAVRVVIVILSGEPLDQISTSTVVSSRKKEKVDVLLPPDSVSNDKSGVRKVPPSFGQALEKLEKDATSTLNTTYLRALATHPTGNPVLQLFLKFELRGVANLNVKDDNSVFKRLFPEDSFDPGSDTAKFAQGLLYDPSGSRILETIIQNASGKIFKKMYRSLWKDAMPTMAKNDIASYVAMHILQRIGKDDLTRVLEEILPVIPDLVQRNRVTIIKVLIERCEAREVELNPLLAALEGSYGRDPAGRLLKILKLDMDADVPISEEPSRPETRSTMAVDLHGSLLAQSILRSSSLGPFLQSSILSTTPDILLLLCREPSASRVIQAALEPSTSPVSFRRQFVPLLIGHVATLAIDVSGSHVVDALWDATSDLHFMKERIARALLEHEAEIRESRYGRAVWHNWSMDMFQRRKAEWQAHAKSSPSDGNAEHPTPKKSGIELARARFAVKKSQGNQSRSRPSTVSANA